MHETIATSKVKLENEPEGVSTQGGTERWRVGMYGAVEYRRYDTININVCYATRCRFLTPVKVNSTSLSNISGSSSGFIYGSVVGTTKEV